MITKRGKEYKKLKAVSRCTEDVTKKVKNIIEKELNMPEINNEIDKMHRIGKVNEENGKKKQDVIIKFKTHAARYAVYDVRKKERSAKFLPNLTKRRGKLLFDALKICEDHDKVNFVYADIHGDTKVRLNAPHNEKYVFAFTTIDQLTNLLEELM